MADLIVFGAGDGARLAHYYFTHEGREQVVAFTVDRQYRHSDAFCGLPVVDFETVGALYPPERHRMFVAVGYSRMNKARAEKFYQAKELGYELVSYVSSRCSFLTDEPVGENCFILEDNTIQPFVKIGHDVTLWSGNHIGHDSVIEDHCFISSHCVIGGRAHIQPYCFIGINATVRNGVTIARETLIGPGAVILGDTVPQGAYIQGRAKLSHLKSEEIEL